MTGPQPQSSDTAVRSPVSFSNPHCPVTPHHLPRAKSSPSHPVLRGHTSHVFKECHLGPSFYCTVKGAVPFVPVPTRLSPGEMRQAAILGLTDFPRTGVNGPGEFRFLLKHPTQVSVFWLLGHLWVQAPRTESLQACCTVLQRVAP